jgi:hypothetical protein
MGRTVEQVKQALPVCTYIHMYVHVERKVPSQHKARIELHISKCAITQIIALERNQ